MSASIPATATARKVARQPNAPPIHVPSGTPSAMDPVTPRETVARYRPVFPAGACDAAKAKMAGVTLAAAAAATTLRTISTPKDEATTAPRFAPAKMMSATRNSRRGGTRASATAATGAATATVAENAVTSCPAWPSVTPRSVAISGRMPAMT